MALFPEADFKLFIPSPGMIPGTRVDGTLELHVPAPIPRASRVTLTFESDVYAGYGAQSDRSNESKTLFEQRWQMPLRVERGQPLAAGVYPFPFSLDVPAWLPPSYDGTYCHIHNRFHAELEVEWAADPTKRFSPRVVLPPMEVTSEPLIVRSPRNWHPSLVFDLTLLQGICVVGESVTGEIALRGGFDTSFDAIDLTLQSVGVMVMAHRERRYGSGMRVRIPAEPLKRGENVRFRVRWPEGVPSSFRTGFLDHDVVLSVRANLSWSSHASFDIPLQAIPAGSIVHAADDPRPILLGSERISRIATEMAAATGFEVRRFPVLIEGKAGSIRVRMSDGPREGKLGIDVDYGLPDLELGIEFRGTSRLERARDSTLLPRWLRPGGYSLRVASDAAEGGPLAIPVPEPALEKFFATMLDSLDPSNEVRLTDHHLGFRYLLKSDGVPEMVNAARWTKTRAEVIGKAIAELPFAAIHPDAEAAWSATAREEQGYLLPHVPALHGIVRGATTLGGESREMGVRLRTRHDRTIAAVLDLRQVPMPPAALAKLEQGTAELLLPVRAVFPRARAHSTEKVTLEGATFTPDPRPLLAVLDVFLNWLLDARGERAVKSAYR